MEMKKGSISVYDIYNGNSYLIVELNKYNLVKIMMLLRTLMSSKLIHFNSDFNNDSELIFKIKND